MVSKRSRQFMELVNKLYLAAEYDDKVSVLPGELRDKLEALIEEIEEESYHNAMHENA